ncbi:hypothetical protein SAMN04488005_2489 [Yoonia tamlensis]|uniref:Flagellar assembly protein FliH n=1 Tax=Yoonia tamlensis TaxID=390270 RepID=A0A1I6HC23_9RHOB|nr:hypothetical protein [Yoonia tamlensis]SFR51934.1 hypothetical protein SAMN04488005_2489 [Yoonia tamlensis]
MAQQLALESFEHGLDSADSAEFETGYQEGYAAALAVANEEKSARDDAFIQAITDIEFSYSEAQTQILEMLSPLFTAVIEKLLPRISVESFGLLLIQTIHEAAQIDTAKMPVIHLHPSQRQNAQNLAREHGLEIVIEDDPDLSPQAAWIGQGKTETYLDLDGLLAQTRATLSAISDVNRRTSPHE